MQRKGSTVPHPVLPGSIVVVYFVSLWASLQQGQRVLENLQSRPCDQTYLGLAGDVLTPRSNTREHPVSDLTASAQRRAREVSRGLT